MCVYVLERMPIAQTVFLFQIYVHNINIYYKNN